MLTMRLLESRFACTNPLSYSREKKKKKRKKKARMKIKNHYYSHLPLSANSPSSPGSMNEVVMEEFFSSGGLIYGWLPFVMCLMQWTGSRSGVCSHDEISVL